MGDSMSNSESERQTEFMIKCECCALTEECTPEYIEKVRERYNGTWICGLCGEAVKDEILRSPKRMMSTEEALNLHMNFCKQFKSSCCPPPVDTAVHLITAMRQILRRSLDSPRSAPSSPARTRMLDRSASCLPTLSS